MKLEHTRRVYLAIALFALGFGAVARSNGQDQDLQERHHARQQVIVPEEDRFTPFAQTIRSGDTVQWINMDSDDHTVVSDDFVNTAGVRGLNVLLKGTDNNNGKPGTLTIRFNHPGTFVYYCRFHAHLDGDHQPVAPGPDGGIQDSKGNFGTPMMGVITVLPRY
jgi:plastocyanin